MLGVRLQLPGLDPEGSLRRLLPAQRHDASLRLQQNLLKMFYELSRSVRIQSVASSEPSA